VWTLLGSDVMAASVLTQFPRSFGLGGMHTPTEVRARPVLIVVSGVVCHIGPTNANRPSDRWTAAFKFLSATNGKDTAL
jgi:hypothetical protein